jgi:hypothetical protein
MNPTHLLSTVMNRALPSILVASLTAVSASAQTSRFQFTDPTFPGVGWSVRGLGDVSGDGVPDLVTGTFRLDCGFGGCGGAPSRVAVLSGVDGAPLVDVIPAAPDGSGFAVDLVGDVDGDGVADFVIGAPFAPSHLQPDGEVRVHSGADGAVLHTIGAPAPFAGFGSSVAGVGDVDGDSIPDFAGAWSQAVHVYSGATGAQIHAFSSSISFPWRTDVSRYGDLDLDGRADVLVSFVESGPGLPGVVEIRSGANGTVLRSFAAPTPEPTFGWSIDAAGDVDGDGKIDVIVGAPQIDFSVMPSGPGYAAVFSSTGALIRKVDGTQMGGHFGIAVAGGGDVDGDAFADYAIAKSCEDGAAGCSREAFVHAGANGALLFTLPSAETGLEGMSLDFVGDLDGDTRTELAFGSACSEAWSQCGTLDVLSFGPGGGTSYCTAGTSSHGCVPSIATSGIPSASASSGFTISASGLEGQKQGLVFYGISGRLAQPWGTGTSFLCVKAPTQRTTVQSTGGAPQQCDGALAIDWLAYVAANPGALGAPFSAGDIVQAQAWYRDPPSPKTTSLTGAVEFVLVP